MTLLENNIYFDVRYVSEHRCDSIKHRHVCVYEKRPWRPFKRRYKKLHSERTAVLERGRVTDISVPTMAREVYNEWSYKNSDAKLKSAAYQPYWKNKTKVEGE